MFTRFTKQEQVDARGSRVSLWASGSDASSGDLQHPERAVQDPDVRWALALLIDVKAVAMATYRGAATISAIEVPPTGMHPAAYHQPMEEWLKGFEIDTGKRKVKPLRSDRRQTDRRHAASLDGRADSGDPKEIARAFGMGWWKTDPRRRRSCRRPASASVAPLGSRRTGKPFTVRVMVEGDLRPVMTRAGTMIVQQWKQAGIDAKVDAAQGTLPTRRGCRRFRHLHWLERRDPGEAIRICPTSWTVGIRSCRRAG
jgi:peptide/nickel transport system substrate-binding protein